MKNAQKYIAPVLLGAFPAAALYGSHEDYMWDIVVETP